MFENLISSNAALWPDRPAIIIGDQRYSYQRMSRDIGRSTAWLKKLALPPGTRALICVPHVYVHWVLTFALDRAGLSSSSAVQNADVPALVDRLGVDVVFSTGDVGPDVYRPAYRIDQAWFDNLGKFQEDEARAAPGLPTDPIRCIVTSGTTGAPKAILLDRRTVDRGVEILTLAPDLHRPGIRTATTVTMNSIGGWNTALWTWLEGGTFNVLTAERGFVEAMQTDGLDLVFAAPTHLQTLLKGLPEGFEAPSQLIVGVFGGSISSGLADQCRSRLTSNIVVTYGSTEAGISAIGRVDVMDDPEAAGLVCPWAEFEVRDEAGEILFRTDYACNAYAFEDGPSEMFRDGWFCPGDLGSVTATGVVKILGRTNDLLNVGGSKFLAALVDRIAMGLPGVEDAGTFAVPDEDGIDMPLVALVLTPGAEVEALRARLEVVMGRSIRLLVVDAIPRNAMGKIQRPELRALALESWSAGAAPC